MAQINHKSCKKWIKNNKDDFLDECGEYNYTAIAEALAEHFDLYSDHVQFMIPDDVFDLVVEEVS